MANVQLQIAGRNFAVTCGDGEEAHIAHLASIIDAKAREAGGASGSLSESRMLLFAALLLADELHEKSRQTAAPAPVIPLPDQQMAATALSKLAERMENLAIQLEEIADKP